MASDEGKTRRSLQERDAQIAQAAKRTDQAADPALVQAEDSFGEGMPPHWQAFYRSIRDAVKGMRE